ncbi:MAG: excisionase [Blautia caecimuris]
MSGNKKKELPWWQKYTLTLNEASEYFGIGYKKLKLFVQEHSDEDFVLWNGNRALIKREQFEKYMDSQMNAI